MAFDKELNAGIGALESIFGGSSSTSGSGTTTGTVGVQGSKKRTERLKLDKPGIEALVRDVLASEQGLSAVFNEENVAGVFNSSVAAQASGDLVAQIAREISKLTAVKEEEIVEDTVKTTDTETAQTGGSEQSGLLDTIGGFLGF